VAVLQTDLVPQQVAVVLVRIQTQALVVHRDHLKITQALAHRKTVEHIASSTEAVAVAQAKLVKA
jgi:hypothetical protein